MAKKAKKKKRVEIDRWQLQNELSEMAKSFQAGYPLPSGTLLRSEYLSSLCRDAATVIRSAHKRLK